MFAYYIISYSAVTYDDYEYPGWAEGMGLCISFSSMIWVPAYFVYYLVTGPGTIRYYMTKSSSNTELSYKASARILLVLLLLTLLPELACSFHTT